MGKKKSWFTYVKRLFIPESKPRSEVTTQKLKKWRWIFRSFKFRQYPELKAPQEALNEATEEQRKHAVVVAIATAAAAEAAVAAANAAAKVVRLTNTPHEIERKNQHLAAIKIQSAYRGHVARKALSALKGLVKLQAAIRGELVRSSVGKTLPSMSLISSTRSQVQTKRVPTLLDYIYHGEKRHSLGLKEGSKSEEQRPRGNIHRNWDLSLVSKEEMEALYLQKQEAIAKQDRMRQYSFSQQERRNNRRPQESMNHKENRKSSRFDQFVEIHQHKDKEKLKHLFHPNTIAVDAIQLSQMKQITAHKQQRVEELNSSSSLPRRSFCQVKQKSIGEDRSLLNSPAFPTYMAATKSAKAKSRSLSTPKQRLRLCNTHSGELSPYMLKLSTWSSFSGEITSGSKRNSTSQHTPSFGTLI